MRAIICESPGNLKVLEKEKPTPSTGEALLKIKHVGICGTDLHAYAGNQAFFTYPRILGHELSAEVIKMNGTADHLKVGDRVIIIPYIHCGTCRACAAGKTNCCTSLKVFGVHIDGGMQEFVTYPADLLIAAPDLSPSAMAIIEPLCIGWHAVKRARVESGDVVVVSGCGPIGQGIIWSAKYFGAKVIACDLNEFRLKQAVKHFGADHSLVVGPDIHDQLHQITKGKMADVAFDATGIKPAMEKGIDYVGAGGQYILVGLYNGDLSFHHPSLHAREISLLCSRNATRRDFEEVINAIDKHGFPIENYVTHKADFLEFSERINEWSNPNNQVIKAMLDL